MIQRRPTSYRAQSFDHLHGLEGISDEQIAEHLSLYAGYAKHVNLLNEELATCHIRGKPIALHPEVGELTRRLGFEYDGMILHEYYFSNLRRATEPAPRAGSALARALADAFGSVDQWRMVFYVTPVLYTYLDAVEAPVPSAPEGGRPARHDLSTQDRLIPHGRAGIWSPAYGGPPAPSFPLRDGGTLSTGPGPGRRLDPRSGATGCRRAGRR